MPPVSPPSPALQRLLTTTDIFGISLQNINHEMKLTLRMDEYDLLFMSDLASSRQEVTRKAIKKLLKSVFDNTLDGDSQRLLDDLKDIHAIAISSKSSVAAAVVWKVHLTPTPTMAVMWLVVKLNWRGRGVGSYLWKLAIWEFYKGLTSEGGKVIAAVDQTNSQAKKFWEKNKLL